MEVLQARIDSFKKARRVKNPSKPSSTVTVRWPHPLNFKANPETLGAAGFFYNPSYDGPDSVTCYFCDKELEGWEEDDEPHAIHWEKCSQTCCWAIVRCGLLNDMDVSNKFVFTDKTRMPTHKLMEKARFDTFDVGNGWIHDQVKNHNANSKMMARAGFVYTPQQSNDDLVTCLYCNTSLSGWDADDDPMEEHRRRKKSCPFFSASAPALTNRTGSQSQSTKPPSSRSKPPTRSTSKSKPQDISLPTKAHDGELPRKSSRPKSKASKSHEVRRKMDVVEISSDEESGKVIDQPNNPLPSVPTVSPIQKSGVESNIEPEPESEPNKHVHPAPSTSQSLPQTPPKKVIPALFKPLVEPNNSLPSVPTVSPIREIDEVGDIEHEAETNNHVFPPSSTPHHSLPQIPPPKVIPLLSKLVVQPNNPPPSVPAVSPIGEIDVGGIAPETQPEPNNYVDTTPSTPQRSLPQTPPPKKVIISVPKVVSSTSVELIPALSKLPSIPLHTLTEAELDMTVEEWIRYQMDVEYDKFRRDGERELQRFRNQAEEVRRAIEGL